MELGGGLAEGSACDTDTERAERGVAADCRQVRPSALSCRATSFSRVCRCAFADGVVFLTLGMNSCW